jgi:excisionase family DNA binding protein
VRLGFRALRTRIATLNERDGLVPVTALGALLDEFVDRVAERVAVRLRDQERPSSIDLLSISEAAAALRCKPQRVYDLRSAGRLPRTVEGRRAVVRREDLERLIEAE